MALDDSTQGHTDSTSSSFTVDASRDTSSVYSACSHLHHLLEFTSLCKGDLIKTAELEREQNLSRITVGEDTLTRLDLKLHTTRHSRSIHSHHWVNCQCQSINTGTKLSIKGFLRVISLLADASTPETTGNNVPSEGYNRTILHHVRIFLNLQETTLVTDDHNGFYVLRRLIIVLFRAFYSLFQAFFVLVFFVFFVLSVFHCLIEEIFRHKTVIFGQSHLIVIVGGILFLVRLNFSVCSGCAYVFFEVHTVRLSFVDLVNRHKLINNDPYSLINVGSYRVNQEVLRQDRPYFNDCTRLDVNTHSLQSTIKDGLCCRLHFLYFFQDNLSNASTKDCTVQD